MGHTIRTIVGVFLLVLAVIGALLPLVQGWIFFLAAVAVLGTDHVIIRWCLRKMEWGRELVKRFWRKKDPEGPG